MRRTQQDPSWARGTGRNEIINSQASLAAGSQGRPRLLVQLSSIPFIPPASSSVLNLRPSLLCSMFYPLHVLLSFQISSSGCGVDTSGDSCRCRYCFFMGTRQRPSNFCTTLSVGAISLFCCFQLVTIIIELYFSDLEEKSS
jgi:hypothetical protein